MVKGCGNRGTLLGSKPLEFSLPIIGEIKDTAKTYNFNNSITNSPNMRSPGFNRHKPDFAVKNALPVELIGSMAIDFLSSGV